MTLKEIVYISSSKIWTEYTPLNLAAINDSIVTMETGKIDVRACTCFKNTCNWGCDPGSTVTSKRGRNILSRMFWNDVTIPISLYILYRRGSCKTEYHTLQTYAIQYSHFTSKSRLHTRTSKSIIHLPLNLVPESPRLISLFNFYCSFACVCWK